MSLIDTPNIDQAKAEEEFVDFLLDPLEKEMRLIGPGGTGKSWLVKRLITKALKEYVDNCRILGLEPDYTNYVLTAMTNKAAQSLEDATGLEVVTIHSYLCLVVKPNYTTGKHDLKRREGWDIKQNTLIFIDEAYTMDSKLLDELRASTMNCKIVFIGDDKQLEPVESLTSPIDNLKVRTSELTIPVRNSGSPDLQALCQLMRDNVEGVVNQAKFGTPHVWPKIPIVPGVIDHIPDEDTLKYILDNVFNIPNGQNVILGFSNSRVNLYNDYLRGIRGQTSLFDKGEILISNDTYERGKFRIRNEQTVEIVSAGTHISQIQIDDLQVPVQYVRTSIDPSIDVPAIIDRDFHKEALSYFSKRAKRKEISWKPYFDLKEGFADFRNRDACTIHKIQGSTKDLVLLDLNNIGSCNFTTMVARMLYVGVSRPRHRILLYGNLPERYGGVLI